LDKERIKNIYVGECYTVCTVGPSPKINMKKNKEIQLTFNQTE